MEAAPHPWPALGVLLMRDGLVTKDELEEILREQQDTRQQRISGRRLGEILIQRGRVTPIQVARLVAEQYELPFVDFDVADLDVRAATVLSEEEARRFAAVPLSRRSDGSYLLAIADPATVLFSDELRKLLGSVPGFVVVGADAIERAIDFVHGNPQPAVDDDGVEHTAVVLPFTPESTVAAGVATSVSHGPLAQTWPPLGALLVRDGFLTEGDLDIALARQRLSPSHRLGELLVQNGVVTQSVVARLVAEQYELPFVELSGLDVDASRARLLPEEVARRLCAVPVASAAEGRLEVAIADPTSAVYSDELQQLLDAPLTFVVASPDAIHALLDIVHLSEPEPVLDHVEPAATDEWTTEAPEPAAPETELAWTIVHVTGDDLTGPPTPEPSVAPAEADDPESKAFEEPEVFDLVFPPYPEHDHEPEQHPLGDEASSLPAEEVPDPPTLDASEDDDEPSWTSRLELADEPVLPDEPETTEPPALEITLVPVTEAVEVEPAVADPTESQPHADAPQATETGPETEPAQELPALSDGFEDLFAPPFAAPATPGPVPFEGSVEPVDSVEPAADDHQVDPVDVEPVGAVAEVEPVVVAVAPVAAEREDLEPEPDLEAAVVAALDAGASTLHFSPQDAGFSVRVRVDGLVRELGTSTTAERDTLVSQLEAGGAVRTHVVPTSRGEKTTLFVVARPGEPTAIAQLAPDAAALGSLRAALETPSGALLVCGPAGSGTTTTLYAALAELASPDRVVTTIEHPVLRPLEGVDQIEVDPGGEVTFASALRDLRFTDPDVVLVGDLVDRETAELALQTAYEGRRVLAGFRAPGAAAAVLRLASMGVDSALLASSLGCVTSQRLVRTICPNCRETHYASDAELEALGHSEDGAPRLLAHGRGCPACEGSGFRGRTALFEVVPMTAELRQLVSEGASEKKLRRTAVAAGVRTLREEGVRLCLEGVTTVAELERVLGHDA